MHAISNNQLTVNINPFGAELSNIINNKNNREYLWQGDPAFWKRRSPILFPIVGSLWNGEFRQDGKIYNMSQHGFARDCDFELISQSQTEVLYRFVSNKNTLEAYPFHFELYIGYKLDGNRLEVIWKVKNTGDTVMHFQIGAHPAFFYPDFNISDTERGYFSFDTDSIDYTLIAKLGCVDPSLKYTLSLNEDHLLPINVNTFDKDALIIENSQVKSVSLLNCHKQPQITLHFDAPLVGLWAPKEEDSPFVCIEPWYGRCDRVEYVGEYKDRDWMNHLDADATFDASYVIEIN